MNRRAALGALGALGALAAVRPARAFGQSGIFNPRLLVVGGRRLSSPRDTAPSRWAWELVRRTSAPARLVQSEVAADHPRLLAEPFAIWAGEGEAPHLSLGEVKNLARFLRLGGMLLIDDSDPAGGTFGQSTRRELMRVLPEQAPVKLDASHVIYKSYYMVDRPIGRVLGPPQVEAIVRGRSAQVIWTAQDVLGALARSPGGGWALETTPAGAAQRERATRFAVNLAMYLLCSDYKDDQVHAPWLMRRRAGRRP